MKIKNPKAEFFYTLSFDDKVKELKKLSKRANVRLAYLEEKNKITNAYKYAEKYNKDRKKNRFYEGKNYRTTDDVNNAFEVLNNFMNDNTSHMNRELKADKKRKEVERDINNFVSSNVKNDNFSKLIDKAKKYSKLANKRLKELEKNGLNGQAYGYAEYYNSAMKRKKNRFYTGEKLYKSKADVINHIEELQHFLGAKTSTVEGYRNTQEKRINKFREHGVNIPKGSEDEFNQFLETSQFNALKSQLDSNQIIDIYVSAKKKNKTVEEINKEFKKFLEDTEDTYTIDKVQENLDIAPWKNKEKQSGFMRGNKYKKRSKK